MSALTQRIVEEVESAPASVQAEVLDFVLFVKSRNQESTEPPIQHTPGVCGGDACIRKTRITVWHLEQARRNGICDEDLLKDYPSLNQQDLSAAWDFVAVHSDEIEAAIRANEKA